MGPSVHGMPGVMIRQHSRKSIESGSMGKFVVRRPAYTNSCEFADKSLRPTPGSIRRGLVSYLICHCIFNFCNIAISYKLNLNEKHCIFGETGGYFNAWMH